MTTTAAPADRYFNSGNLRIHYLDWGNEGAKPLILLHHISSNAHTWDDFARNVRSRYRVLAMDMRGHGDSAWAGEGNYTTEHYASDVTALIQHLGLRNVVVLGGSTGGRVALVAAAQNADRVAALVMEDVGAVRPATISQGFADRVATGDPQFDTVEEWAKSLQGQNQRTPYRFFQNLALHGTKRLPNGKLGLKRDVLIQRDFVPLELWHYVEKVKAPFLLMIGTESTIVGQDQQTRFKQIRPDIEMVTVQGAGHIIVHDKPEEFERLVLDFLGRHGV
ncbi:MAG: alpha/beta hydrolase [Chloroflexi bacterium]|nr:alpha/beta hydrolase [Chloroflexota bacterium]